MKPRYKAIAVRSGRWWALSVPELEGVFSQARRLDQADPIIREAIGLLLEVPDDSFDIVIEPQMESLGDLRVAIEDAHRARQAFEEAQEASSTAMRRAVRELRSSGYTARDTGVLLGVSNQRISQIERSGGSEPTRTP
ncbi:MAG: type II toxin-antitoxin system HicB family antitoxin [Candidatus Limnocylindrales bacterium]